MRFVLTVRKNYRNVPYHNWLHAFSVAHAIYTVIKQTKHEFTPNQVNEQNSDRVSHVTFVSLSVLLCLLRAYAMILIIAVKRTLSW